MADGVPPFSPSKRFAILHGEGVSRRQAKRTLSSILYNGDSHPDLAILTCQLSVSLRRALTYSEAAAIAAAEGASFDDDGWLVDRESGNDAGRGEAR